MEETDSLTTSPPKKKPKIQIPTMEETDSHKTSPSKETHPNPPSLLEQLRKSHVVVDPSTNEEMIQKAKLIIKHKSEFPSDLENVISTVISSVGEGWETQAKYFLNLFYDRLRVWLCGGILLFDERGTYHEPKLNRHVDTEEEVEVAIRFFPKVLTNPIQARGITMHGKSPIVALFLHPAQTVSFVPLFLELGVMCDRKTILQLLFGGICNKPEDDCDEYLSALIRLRQNGYMVKEDIYECEVVHSMFEYPNKKDSTFVEKRLRFLIEWEPSLLMKTDLEYECPFLLIFSKCDRSNANTGIAIFEVLFELGMLYFPKKLGFLFYASTFPRICKMYGTKQVGEIVCDKLFTTLREQNGITLQNLIFSAATDEEISLDGLYTLFRSNPMALLPEQGSP